MVRAWNDPTTLPGETIPIMIADGFDARQRGNVGQFCMVTPYILRADGSWVGTWSSNSNHSPIDLNRIAAMQTADEFDRDTKMRWLTIGESGEFDGSWGSPCACTGDWRTATDGRMIGAVYAGNPVTVLETRTMTVRFNERIETVPMCRIQTGWDVVHKVTVIDRNNNNFGDRPRGRIYLPIWTQYAEYWLMERWLV